MLSGPSFKARIGFLGAGQLSRMLAEAAHRLGLEPVILASSSDEPAAQVCSKVVLGNIQDEQSLRKFFSQVEIVTYENDFLPYEKLKPFDSHVKFLPDLSVLELLQDKIQQKEILNRLKIPNAEMLVYEPKSEGLQSWAERVLASWGKDSVIKWARGGYDGKGVLLSPSTPAEVVSFVEPVIKKGMRVFAEKKIKYRRELAAIACYSISKEFAFYPLVISEQDKGMCKRVSGPATRLGVSSALEQQAQTYTRALAENLDLVGTFALEMFEDESGSLIANEIAPRVHNSGHFSLDACDTSQFENHLRAILGLKLGCTEADSLFVMLNLLGPETSKIPMTVMLPKISADIHLHWYGKSEIRARRKLGHINALVRGSSSVDAMYTELESVEREWLAQFSCQTRGQN